MPFFDNRTRKVLKSKILRYIYTNDFGIWIRLQLNFQERIRPSSLKP